MKRQPHAEYEVNTVTWVVVAVLVFITSAFVFFDHARYQQRVSLPSSACERRICGFLLGDDRFADYAECVRAKCGNNNIRYVGKKNYEAKK